MDPRGLYVCGSSSEDAILSNAAHCVMIETSNTAVNMDKVIVTDMKCTVIKPDEVLWDCFVYRAVAISLSYSFGLISASSASQSSAKIHEEKIVRSLLGI